MENGHESGYSLPPDEIPKTSTPERPGEKMALSEHFLYEDDVYFDATIGFSGDIHLETTGSTAFLSSKMIHTKTDGEAALYLSFTMDSFRYDENY